MAFVSGQDTASVETVGGGRERRESPRPLVVSVELEVAQWILTYKFFNRLVVGVFEPPLPSSSDILLKSIE
jgi:hypothetical protein